MESGSRRSESLLKGNDGDNEKAFTPPIGVPNHPAPSMSTAVTPIREADARAPRDLRSVVAARFMRMLRAHDRARITLLGAHSIQTR